MVVVVEKGLRVSRETGMEKGNQRLKRNEWKRNGEWRRKESRECGNRAESRLLRRNSGKRDSNSRIFVSEADHRATKIRQTR